MDVFEVIKKRRSVRTFEKDISEEDKQKIIDFANNVNNPYDIKIEWKILDAKEYGLNSPVIVGTNTYIAGKMKKIDHSEEAFGYAFEQIILFCSQNYIGTTWIAGTMNRNNFEKAMDLKDDEVMPCVSPLGYVAKKMSLREGMMRKSIKADSRNDFKDLFFDKSFNKPLLEEDAKELKIALDAIRLAPSAVNKQPWRIIIDDEKIHFYEKSNKGYKSSSGWDIQKIDMGIAMCHFDLIMKNQGINPSLLIEEPNIDNNDYIYISTFVLNK